MPIRVRAPEGGSVSAQDELATLNLPSYQLRISEEEGKRTVLDPVRRKYVRLTPEEWVRQHFLQYLIQNCGYPASLIAVEMGIRYQRMPRRADIVVHNRRGEPFLMAECKAPDVGINQSTFDQVSRYNRVVKARYLAVTNGLNVFCWRIDVSTGQYEFLDGIPRLDADTPS